MSVDKRKEKRLANLKNLQITDNEIASVSRMVSRLRGQIPLNIPQIFPVVDIHKKINPSSGYPQKDRHIKPDEVFRSLRYSNDLDQQIRYFCKKYTLTFREFFEHVTLEYFNLWISTKRKIKSIATSSPLNFLTSPKIIEAYETYTLQKWNFSNDRLGKKYNEEDIRLIELSFILSIEQKLNGKNSKISIKRFSYFVLKIEQLKTQKFLVGLEDFFNYLKNRWKKYTQTLRDNQWKNSTG